MKHTSALLLLLAAGVVSAFAVFNVPLLYENVGERLVFTVKTLLGTARPNELEMSILERSGMIRDGARLFLQRPLLGYGLDCFRFASGLGTYSHNNYVEILFGVGIPGIITYYSMYFFPLVKGIKNWIIQNNTNVILGVTTCIGCLSLLGISLLMKEITGNTLLLSIFFNTRFFISEKFVHLYSVVHYYLSNSQIRQSL